MITDYLRIQQARWIWTLEFGPVEAERLIAVVEAARFSQPHQDLATVIANLDGRRGAPNSPSTFSQPTLSQPTLSQRTFSRRTFSQPTF